MRYRRTGSILVAALLSAATATLSAPAGAQDIVTISPPSGSWTGTAPLLSIPVHITWCALAGPLGGLQVTLNGQPLSLAFEAGSDPNCNDYGVSWGNVDVGSGTHVLRAEGSPSGAFATATYVYAATVNTPPTAVFSYSPNPGAAGSTVTLDGSASHDPETSQLAHHWEWQDEAGNWSRGGYGPTVQTTWSAPGVYGVHLWVFDDAGARDDVWGSVTINAPPPPPPPPPAPVVSPRDSTVQREHSQLHAEVFTVRNPGTAAAAFTLQAFCSGYEVSGCAVSRSPVTIPAGDSTRIAVTYAAGGGSGGLLMPPNHVGLKAWRSAAVGSRDSASYVVKIPELVSGPAPPPAPLVGDLGDNTRLDRGACVMVAAGQAGYECGDLRLAHALPATRVLNRARAPTLVYSSQHARPHPLVAFSFRPTNMESGWFPGQPQPHVQQVHAVLRHNGVILAQKTWTGLTLSALGHPHLPMPTYRFALGFDTNAQTGVYDFTVEVTAVYSDGTVENRGLTPGTGVVVNRIGSPFGAGWWIAGVESLHVPQNDTTSRLWVGGQGSYRLYRKVTANQWAADPWDRPDTLTYEPATLQYTRTLPGRAEVRFDALGKHVYTVSPTGQWTWFEWSGSQLVRIHLPRSNPFDTGYSYLFEYDNPGGRLSRVVPPGIHRPVSVAMDGGRVTSITGPDLHPVSFGYSGTSLVPASRTDRRGVQTNFAFDAGARLSAVTSTMGTVATSDDVAIAFRAAESQGLDGPVPADSVYTLVDGPRPDADVLDHTRLWLDRQGAPYRVVDASGATTRVARGDPRWPGRVTSSTAHNGFRTTSNLDDRGRVVASIQWDPYGDGRHATTLYRWHPVWDAVTEVTLPEGEVTHVEYDAAGRRAWEQAGPSEATRVRYHYHPSTNPTAPGLMERVELPGGRNELFEYDARGNLSATQSPLGIRAIFQNDAAGRLVATLTPIDSAQTRFRKDTTIYDPAGRPERSESWGPVTATGQLLADSQRTVVVNDFDQEGNPVAVSRWSSPDPAGIGVVTTRWEYDALGRPTVEFAPDATPGNPLDNPRDSTFYDRAGNVTRVRTRRGDQVHMLYDATGRLTRRIVDGVYYPELAIGGASFPHYTDGLAIPVDTVALTYDFRGHLLTASNRDSRIRRTYYPGGALATDTMRVRGWDDQVWDRHVYGLRNRYDRNGRRTALMLPSQMMQLYSDSIAYQYNSLGQLGSVWGFQFHYNADGQMERMVRPNGIELRQWFDEDGRLLRRVEHAPGYLGTNRLGQATDTIHDDRLHYDVRGKVIYADLLTDSVRMAYAPLGALTYMHRQPRPWDQPGTFDMFSVETFATDALGNVVLATESDVRAGERETGYQYQPGTGRLTRTLIEGQPLDVEYDASGNQVGATFLRMQQRHNGSWALTSEYTRQYYSADHRLHTLDKRSSASLVQFPTAALGVFEEYRYDALGRRIALRSRRGNSSSTDGSIRRFVWDGDQLIFETRYPGGDGVSSHWLNADTATYFFERSCEEMKNCGAGPGENPYPLGFSPHYGRLMYVHAGGIDAPLAMVRTGYGRDTVFFEPFVIYPHANWRGTYSTGSYGSGTVPPSITLYDPVTHLEQRTEVRIGWPGADTRAYLRVGAAPRTEGWMGSLIDEHRDDSGLLYRRNRYYNPEEGRFTQEDPIGLAGGMNLYGYGNADPVQFADPFGLIPCSALRRHIDNVAHELQGYVVRYIHHLAKGEADSGHRKAITDRQNQLRRQKRRYDQNKCRDDDDHDDWSGGQTMEALIGWVPPPYQVEGVHGWRGARGVQRMMENMQDRGFLINIGPPTQQEVDAIMAMGAAGATILMIRAASRMIIKF